MPFIIIDVEPGQERVEVAGQEFTVGAWLEEHPGTSTGFIVTHPEHGRATHVALIDEFSDEHVFALAKEADL